MATEAPESAPAGSGAGAAPGELETLLLLPQTAPRTFTVQPGKQVLGWAQPVTEPVPGCPPGLEHLAQLEAVKIVQARETTEMMLKAESHNSYAVCNPDGEQMYLVWEDAIAQHASPETSGAPGQPDYLIHIVDCSNREVMRMKKDSDGWCRSKTAVEVPVGRKAADVYTHMRPTWTAFKINDEEGKTVLLSEGPKLWGGCCGTDISFSVTSLDGPPIATITRRYPGFMQDQYTKADNFEIKFPRDMDVRQKATLIGVAFVLDFAEFENK